MNGLTRRGLIGALAGVAALLSWPALAHHGWSWTSDAWFELEGTITEIYVGQPHVTLKVDDGATIWDVDLAPFRRLSHPDLTKMLLPLGTR